MVLWAVFAGRARHSVRAEFVNFKRRAEDCLPYQIRTATGGYNISDASSPA
jgi:hypothetical protein